MKSYLLYRDRELTYLDKYFDSNSIIRDLELNAIFKAAEKGVYVGNRRVDERSQDDAFLSEVMRRVMMVPLRDADEIQYRQKILNDFITREGFACEFYELLCDLMKKWDKFGRKTNENRTGTNPKVLLSNEVEIMKLFVDTISKLKELLVSYKDRLYSEGLHNLIDRLEEEFPEERMLQLIKLVNDILFFPDNQDNFIQTKDAYYQMNEPKLIVECGFGDGLKLSNITLESIETEITDFHNPYGFVSTLSNAVGNMIPNSFSTYTNAALSDQMDDMLYQAVSYVVDYCAPFRDDMKKFFTSLYSEVAFYRGCVNVKSNLKKVGIDVAFPVGVENDTFIFKELKEVVMAMKQHTTPVGNSCSIKDKKLLVVTGANQGGKSTFLRSIGIAQIMMQCGMFVGASVYQSGIYKEFFTHFTRREDSSMNSGRLDEELRRMSQIVDHLGKSSLVLLNESFSTTTELEGSEIAYDILKAFYQKNVTVLTVTHLLSFAQKVFDEKKADDSLKIDFLSAERLPDGKRTFHMIAHEPELTSFGLDLFEEIVGTAKEVTE